MGYKESLDLMIKRSGKSLKEISEECEKKGVVVNHTYISRLRNGRVDPPNNTDISRILAEVLGGNPKELIWEGFIIKAPEEIKVFLEFFINGMKQVLTQYFKEHKAEFEEDEIKEFLENLHPLNIFEENMEYFKEQNNDFINEYYKKMNEIPPKKFKGITMADDSMEPYLRKKKETMYILEGEYKHGDIVRVVFPDGKKYIRKYYDKGTHALFMSFNPKYEPELFLKKHIKIVGRVSTIEIP